MPTRNVVLTDQQAELIEKLVDSGRYQNASEVLREGLRLLQRRELEDAAKLEALRGALDEAEAAVAAGELYDYSPTLLDMIEEEERVSSPQILEYEAGSCYRPGATRHRQNTRTQWSRLRGPGASALSAADRASIAGSRRRCRSRRCAIHR